MKLIQIFLLIVFSILLAGMCFWLFLAIASGHNIPLQTYIFLISTILFNLLAIIFISKWMQKTKS